MKEHKYRGWIIREYQTLGTEENYFEIWKDGMMWGFAAGLLDAKIMIDRREE